jgi:MFS family permease
MADVEKQVNIHADNAEELGELSQLSLSSDHHEYLLQRHGTISLDPVPTADPKDPLNWPEWKKNYHLILVAYCALTATFPAAGIVSAYQSMAKLYDRPLSSIAYLTSVQILILGIFPFLWVPLMDRYGRKPILTLACFGSMVANIGGGFCKTYGQQMATRAIAAFFICPAMAVGSAVVTELFFSSQRGTRNGSWALMVTIGTPAGPFIMGFVEQFCGTKWVYFIFAFMNLAGLVGWIFADEPIYNRDGNSNDRSNSKWYKISVKNPNPITLQKLLSPLKEVTRIRVLVPAISYAIVFCYANIVIVVEIPQIFGEKFHFNSEQIGLQFLAVLIGSAIGEVLSGPLSDWWMKRCIKKRGGAKVIEDRLWISYNGYILVIVGLIVYFVRVAQAEPLHWNITPLIGAAIAAAGNQIVTTALITFAVDSDYTRSEEAGLFINLCRQVYGFIGPFYFPDMFATLGLAGAGGLMAALVGVCAMVPIIVVHFVGARKFHGSK